MKTCQISHFHFTPGGKTRTETRNTVVVAGAYIIQCRPFSDVDTEIDYIRKMSRVRLSVSHGYMCIPAIFRAFIAVDQVLAEPICNGELATSDIG
jgi:hypothetical protein